MSAPDLTIEHPGPAGTGRSGGHIFGKLFWPMVAVANFAFFAEFGWPLLVAAGLIATGIAWALSVQPKPSGEISDATRALDGAMIAVAGEDLATVCTEPAAEVAAGCVKRRGRIVVMANSGFVDSLDSTQLRGVAAELLGQSSALSDKRLMRVLFVASLSACVFALVVIILLVGPSPGESAIGPLAMLVAFWPILLTVSRSAGSAALHLPIYRRRMEEADQIGVELADRASVLSGLVSMRDWQARHDSRLSGKRRLARRILSPVAIQPHFDARIAKLSSDVDSARG